MQRKILASELNVIYCISLLWLFFVLPSAHAAPGPIPNEPLITSARVDPNLMLLLDSSGSMLHIVIDEPYDPNITYYNCPWYASLPNNSPIYLRIYSYSGYLYYQQGNSIYEWGNSYNGRGPLGLSERCFDNNQVYSAELYANATSGSTRYASGSYGTTLYPGNYLNWYFGSSPTRWGSSAREKPGTKQRIEIARDIAADLVDNLEDIRVGVAKLNSGDGVHILVGVDDIDSNRSTLISAINNIEAGGSTPLAEAMQQLGRYFVEDHNNNLKMYPDTARETMKSAYSIFNRTPRYSNGVRQSSPIQYYCQKSAVALLTDGLPTDDRNIDSSTGLTDYDGDCINRSPACLSYDRKPGEFYESDNGSDYLDDVAMAMYDMDLRPDLTDDSGNAVKNNVSTYTIGFADLAVLDAVLLRETANQSGGQYFAASNTQGLADAFKTLTGDIFAQASASASLSFNASSLAQGAALYATQFNTSYWTGNVFKYSVSEDGTIGAADWNAAASLNSKNIASRFMFTFNRDSGRGVSFRSLGDLSRDQRNDLSTGLYGRDSSGQLRLNYIRGDRTGEGTTFRKRDSLLADIVDSGPQYVGIPDSNWPDFAPFPTTTGQRYSDFKTGSAANRTPMIYVGDNGGIFHGFRADNGEEQLAYLPANLFSSDAQEGYHYLTEKSYAHRFYVDLTPTVADAYVASRGGGTAWRTIAVVGERNGGRGYFALDVTNPGQFTDANANSLLMWEFSSQDDADLGYTFSKPTIALMNNGRWAAIFGNGYNNTGSGRAKLFIVFLDGGLDGSWTEGSDYIVIDTKQGSGSNLNGLSSPAVIDTQGNYTADRIYAGDLFGNLWAFDVSSSNTAQWGLAYGNRPLFNGSTTQPITAQPIVVKNPVVGEDASNSPNVLVLFGTGQFITPTDRNTTDTQSFYGIWDSGKRNLQRDDLVQQTYVVNGSNLRVVTDNTVDYDAQRARDVDYGWYLDLPATGERVVTTASVRSGIVFFDTLIPDTSAVCSFGGSGFLMALKVENGGQPEEVVIDVNNDSRLDDADKLNGYVVSGIRITQGLPLQSTIRGDYIFTPVSDGTILRTAIISSDQLLGRISWRQLSNY